MRSDRFRTLWASHDVREHRSGTKLVHHRTVGDLDLAYEGMDLASDRSLLLIAYTAQPGSASHDGLRLLSTWAATSSETADNAAAEHPEPVGTAGAEAVDGA